MTSWWARRSLRTRITLVVGIVAVVALLAVGRVAGGLLFSALVESGDQTLAERAAAATGAVAGGTPVPPGVRVVDAAGSPVDGRGPRPVDADALSRLAAGQPVTVVEGPLGPQRWVAVPVPAPDGSPRLVLASRDLVGAASLFADAARWLAVAALLGAVGVGVAAWVATRVALRPVDRMRVAAAAVAPGERLPVPPSRDELAALAVEINALLARRDDAVGRLERFTSEAAHELRSPIAALRAQADVAVAHPGQVSDQASVDETWRSVAREAARLSDLVGDLLALARADSGERMPARPVDLVDAVGEALARLPEEPLVAMTLWAPMPVTVAATPAEVAIVLDNVLANARRHAATVVHVSVVPAGRWVRLLVDDDGPGIAPADRDRVFDRFTRLTPEAGEGSGLGLALVARLVAGRGGTTRATTSPDGGTRLVVRWPVG
ncbi:sensor histidine kinase [Actinomycetospora callitridis]|uniref:sensor histidine kinase n=1 Tax=Actinomycetospora callitridis TaxID=913944 RepID=UPI0023666125|nr:HAMP domain-containing sensor histidine kinase [Actinomycetospora callitridis]MDD7919541.1 HAMP domain-containing sensor histidine kinase [Actinomycetospora callitridis]